jgi:hypothetical protein
MAKPTDIPTWATDTNYPAGTDAWSGTATKVEPTSGQKAAGWEPGQRPPAQYQNWWMGLVSDWIAYFGDPGEKSIAFGIHAWNSQRIGLQGRVDDGGDLFWESMDTASHIHCPINLPAGSILTRVVFHYFRPTAGSGIFLGLTYADLAANANTGNVSVTETGTDASLQAREVDLLNTEMLPGVQYHLRVVPNSDNTGFQFFGAELFYIPAI